MGRTKITFGEISEMTAAYLEKMGYSKSSIEQFRADDRI